MNIYLLFALAFGAVTGVAEVRIARVAPAVTSVSVRAARTASFGVRRSAFRVVPRHTEHRTLNTERFVIEAPLTGAATPRAPAHNC